MSTTSYQIIAVDFDGTLCFSNWPELGEPNKPLIEYLITNQEKFGITYNNNVSNAAGRRVRGFTGIGAVIRLPGLTADGWRRIDPEDNPFKKA